jgi:hypothetical protein
MFQNICIEIQYIYIKYCTYTSILYKLYCKKVVFPSPDRVALTKLPLAGNNLIIPGLGEFGK